MRKKTQKEFTLKKYTQKKYETDMLKLLRDKGLKEAVREQLDKIIEDLAGLSYVPNMGIKESADNILYLCNLQEDIKEHQLSVLKERIIHGVYTGRIDGKTDDVALWDDIVEVFGKI